MTLSRGSRAAGLFSVRPLRFLGKYSYGLYMLHVGIMGLGYLYVFPILKDHIHSLVLFHLATAVLAFGVVLPLALLSFHFYEKPILSLKRFFDYRQIKATALP